MIHDKALNYLIQSQQCDLAAHLTEEMNKYPQDSPERALLKAVRFGIAYGRPDSTINMHTDYSPEEMMTRFKAMFKKGGRVMTVGELFKCWRYKNYAYADLRVFDRSKGDYIYMTNPPLPIQDAKRVSQMEVKSFYTLETKAGVNPALIIDVGEYK